MQQFIGSVLVLVAWLGLCGSTLGATTYNFVTPTTQQVSSISSADVTGATMVGMTVTATFSTGFVQTATWAAMPLPGSPTAGGAVGTNWSLRVTGNSTGGVGSGSVAGSTFWNAFRLQNSTGALLTQIVIDGGPGNIAFDTYWTERIPTTGAPATTFDYFFIGPEHKGVGTTDSAVGMTYTQTNLNIGATQLDATVTYSNAIGLGGAGAVGDLFRTLTIVLVAPGATPDGLPSGGLNLNFRADTDQVTYAPTPVPAPSSLILLALGSLGALGYTWRNRLAARPVLVPAYQSRV